MNRYRQIKFSLIILGCLWHGGIQCNRRNNIIVKIKILSNMKYFSKFFYSKYSVYLIFLPKNCCFWCLNFSVCPSFCLFICWVFFFFSQLPLLSIYIFRPLKCLWRPSDQRWCSTWSDCQSNLLYRLRPWDSCLSIYSELSMTPLWPKMMQHMMRLSIKTCFIDLNREITVVNRL